MDPVYGTRVYDVTAGVISGYCLGDGGRVCDSISDFKLFLLKWIVLPELNVGQLV